jgi:DNA-binding NarL/FixJ family response regulator
VQSGWAKDRRPEESGVDVTMGTESRWPEGRRLRAIVVDDHRLFRLGLRTMLEARDIEVVGDAGNGEEALVLAETMRPDVVVMDLCMPMLDGVEATRRIMAGPSGACVLVLTGSEGTDVLDALLAGARGYMLKGSGMDRIADAVFAAACGQTALAPQVAGRLVDRLRDLESARTQEKFAPPMPPLTARESDVLGLLVTGCDNQAIAHTLFISSSTVKHHVTAILHKLGVENRVQAAVEAVRAGAV